MRRIAFMLLALFVFTVPWEYSLNLGEPLGNIARIAGVLVLLAAIPALLQAGRVRVPGVVQWLTLALYLWYCCTLFWSIDADATLDRMRGSFQVMISVWLVWELAESAEDLRMLLRAFVAGAWVLFALTTAMYLSLSNAASQARFAAEGQDPNDTARYLAMALPFAALLVDGEKKWIDRLHALGYLPAGVLGILLTASRGGALAAVVSLVGCAVILLAHQPRRLMAAWICLPVIMVGFMLAVPRETLDRLASIADQLHGGDLNQRTNIWVIGWEAFRNAPLIGSGLGSFVAAARLSAYDTAHNTELSIVVEGGIISLVLFFAVFTSSIAAVLRARGPVRVCFITAFGALLLTTLDATVENNRTTWLLFGLAAFAGRLAVERPAELMQCFPSAATRMENTYAEAAG